MKPPRYFVHRAGENYGVFDRAWAHRVVWTSYRFTNAKRIAQKVCNRLNADEEKWEQAA